MREFYLANEEGVKFELGYKHRILVSSVDNIGFTKEVEYLDFDNIYKKVREKNPIQDISLTLTFLDGYSGYLSLASFLQQAKSVFLYYKSPLLKYCHCEVESLTKSELTFGALQSTLTIKRLSYWFEDRVKEMNVETIKDTRTYSYRYPYTYKETNVKPLTIINHGYSKASVRIHIKGAFENPEINVYKDQKKISTMRILYETKRGELLVDSFPLNQRIEITDKGEKFDGYKYQDFSADNFIFLERGVYQFKMNANVGKPPACTIVVTEGYLTN